ncbi:MAG: hypothetical protein ACJ8BW_13630 [Ktedonobacteraceae bacterium]
MRLCSGNGAPKAIAARKKRAIAISHASTRLVKDCSRRTRNGCLPGRWSVYHLDGLLGFFCANR